MTASLLLDPCHDDGRLAMTAKMTDNLEALPDRVDRIEQKLDSLAVSVDGRFSEVSEAIAEQRRYTEFAFEHLRSDLTSFMTVEFRHVHEKIATLDNRIDKKIAALDNKLDQRIANLDSKMDQVLEGQKRRGRTRKKKE